MPSVMLDTNIVSDLVRNPHGKVAAKIAAIGADPVRVSIIVAAELKYGAARSESPKLRERIEGILSRLDVMPFESPADTEYARIRNDLARAGTPIGWNDLLIAAHALALRLPLVTGNTREFSRVPGLVVENWLE